VLDHEVDRLVRRDARAKQGDQQQRENRSSSEDKCAVYFWHA
jgi:hypothetical protein